MHPDPRLVLELGCDKLLESLIWKNNNNITMAVLIQSDTNADELFGLTAESGGSV